MSYYELRLAKIQYCNPTTCLLPGTPLMLVVLFIRTRYEASGRGETYRQAPL